MKYLSLSIILVSLILSSCSNDNKSINEPLVFTTGKISMLFDVTDAPENVFRVVATLTRSGYDPISGNMNIQNSNSAELLLENILPGTWHLKVDAEDTSSIVLYTGESDVQILAGTITQIQLALNPTGNGIGAIHILVTWGNSQTWWNDYQNNPIYISQNYYEEFGPVSVYVLKDEGIYKMWYAGLSYSARTYIFCATSSDGFQWTKQSALPVLYPGSPGSWDYMRAGSGPVIKEGNLYRMYYHSFPDENYISKIGLATSTNGLNWEKASAPVIVGGYWDASVTASSIIKVDSSYYLYYTGHSTSAQGRIGLAISNDGINWEKYSGNPILVPTQSWEGNSVGFPTVFKEGNTFKMIYQKWENNRNAFGIAYSNDGKHWNKESINPIFKAQNTNNNWFRVYHPNLLQLENESRLYYVGIDGDAASFVCKICVATRTNQ